MWKMCLTKYREKDDLGMQSLDSEQALFRRGGGVPPSRRPLAMAGEAISNCRGCPPCDEQHMQCLVYMVAAVEQIRSDEYEFLKQGTTSTCTMRMSETRGAPTERWGGEALPLLERVLYKKFGKRCGTAPQLYSNIAQIF